MKNSILEELDSVGNRAVAIRLDSILFSPRMIADCAREVAGLAVDEMGVLTVAPNDMAALDSLCMFCSRLLVAKMSSL